MVTKIIQLDEGKEARELVADEGKLLFLTYELEELGSDAQGVTNVIIPMCWDYEQIYIEKEIPEGIDINNIIEK
jgi:hypothetical protein